MRVGWGVEEPDVVVHIVAICVAEALDIFAWGDDVLKVLVLLGSDREDSVRVCLIMGALTD